MFRKKIYILALCLLCAPFIYGQEDSSAAASNEKTTIEILHADVMSQDKIPCFANNGNICAVQILKGRVVLKKNKDIVYTDSMVLDKESKIIDAFGHVKIIDDSTTIFGDYLRYNIKDKKIKIIKNVKLITKESQVVTNELLYNKKTEIVEYFNNGEITHQNIKSNSQYGWLNKITNLAILKNNVVIKDSAFTIYTDSIHINNKTRLATFIAPTKIITQKQKIKTTKGFYLIDSGILNIYHNPIIIDSNTLYSADSIYFNKTSGDGYAWRNFKFYDTANKISINSHYAKFNTKNKYFFASKKAFVVLINKEDDTVYLKADTIQIENYTKKYLDSLRQANFKKSLKKSIKDSLLADKKTDRILSKKEQIQLAQTKKAEEKKIKDSLAKIKDSILAISKKKPVKDSLLKGKKDTLHIIKDTTTTLVKDSLLKQKDTLLKFKNKKDSIDTKNKINDTQNIQLLTAMGNVLVYKNDLQAFSDSIYYSDEDSILRVFHRTQQPIVWTDSNKQALADSIHIYFKQKKMHSIHFISKAFTITQLTPSFYDQLAANKLSSYFKNDTIDLTLGIGNINALNNIKDDKTNYYKAINITLSDSLKVFYNKGEMKKILFVKNVKGKMLPNQSIPKSRRFLPNFKWLDSLQPKDKMYIIDTQRTTPYYFLKNNYLQNAH